MKTKPVLIGLFAVVLLLGIGLFVKAKYFKKAEPARFDNFLQSFNKHVVNQNTDSLATYFDLVWDKKLLNQFLMVITNQQSVNPDESAIVKMTLNIDSCGYKDLEDGDTEITIPVRLTDTKLLPQLTSLVFRVHKKEGKYVIIQVDNQDFIRDYLAFENKIKTKGLTDKDIYSPITLQAFKSAEQLKSIYDSVLWFSHINKQTYYYVVKGEWDYYDPDSAKTYQMGLVNPQLQEIIPPKFDLVYNINGSLQGLVEVEKDHKHGFYNLAGKIVLPVEYDQVFPLMNNEHLGVLRKGDAYYWLEKDYSVIDNETFNVKELLAMLPPINRLSFAQNGKRDITEVNSRDSHSSVLISPSYLADLNIVPPVLYLKNPLRKNVEFYEASSAYKVSESNSLSKVDTGRFEALVYSIRNYFIGGRSEFYDTKNVVLVDKQNNRIFSKDIPVDYTMSDAAESPDKCDGYSFKPVNDTLFELKAGATTSLTLYDDSSIEQMPVYHYLYVHNNKLQEMPTSRLFAFTKYVKMDESYITGCYLYNEKVVTELTPAMLRYMKNEIYADYHYIFKDKKWASIFTDGMNDYKAENENIDSRLTEVDRYNLNWINQRLGTQGATKLAAR